MKITHLLIILLILATSACTLTVHPDGSRTYGTDPAAAAAIAQQVIGDK